MEQTSLPRHMFGTTSDEIRKGNDLCTNKSSFHIAVDLPCGLRGWCADWDRPSLEFRTDRRIKCDQRQSPISRFNQSL